MEIFYKYYCGEKKVLVFMIFIGGNYEVLNYLWEFFYGGWVVFNIYYLGYSGVVRFGDIWIVGFFGIYKGYDYYKGYFERLLYDDGMVCSIYYVRSFDVFKFKFFFDLVDIFLLYDWFLGVYNYGNVEELYRYKKYL